MHFITLVTFCNFCNFKTKIKANPIYSSREILEIEWSNPRHYYNNRTLRNPIEILGILQKSYRNPGSPRTSFVVPRAPATGVGAVAWLGCTGARGPGLAAAWSECWALWSGAERSGARAPLGTTKEVLGSTRILLGIIRNYQDYTRIVLGFYQDFHMLVLWISQDFLGFPIRILSQIRFSTGISMISIYSNREILEIEQRKPRHYYNNRTPRNPIEILEILQKSYRNPGSPRTSFVVPRAPATGVGAVAWLGCTGARGPGLAAAWSECWALWSGAERSGARAPLGTTKEVLGSTRILLGIIRNYQDYTRIVLGFYQDFHMLVLWISQDFLGFPIRLLSQILLRF